MGRRRRPHGEVDYDEISEAGARKPATSTAPSGGAMSPPAHAHRDDRTASLPPGGDAAAESDSKRQRTRVDVTAATRARPLSVRGGKVPKRRREVLVSDSICTTGTRRTIWVPPGRSSNARLDRACFPRPTRGSARPKRNGPSSTSQQYRRRLMKDVFEDGCGLGGLHRPS